MKRHILFQLFMFILFVSGMFISCTDDWVESQQFVVVDDSNLVEARLSFEVIAMNTLSSVTRAADDSDDLQGTAAERKIDNIWVFQFDATNQKLLITPRYYDISDKNTSSDETAGVEVDVLLKPNVASIVYVVANTGSSTWANNLQNFAALDSVRKRTLPDPNYIAVDIGEEPTDLSLPMEGSTGSITPAAGESIKVQVMRMYAKVEVLVEDIPETIVLTDVNISQIPYYCRVGTLNTDDPTKAAEYPIGHNDWNSYAFNPGKKNSDGRYTGKMVLYLPENLQGRNENTEADAARKTEDAPVNGNALRVDFVANYVDIFTGEEKERGRHYAVYPGANNYNDYNIKRNFIYRVRLNIYTDQYNQDIPSSNCFVVKPGQTLSFLPYYRTESGGGYNFKDYLNADGYDETKKINDSDTMSENIKIIWQTLDAIGDNTAGDRVWVDRRSEASDEYHRKIHVKTGKRGNALIAAYNSCNEIIWSWHIWVTENEPANVSNAIVYSTYAWNERGILNNVRVPGYAIMSCNLGALKYYPNDVNTLDPDTHGMLYQWGRKDPFPPATDSKADKVDYIDKYTGQHYGNDNTTVVGKTAGTDTEKLFHSLQNNNTANNIKDAIQYTIQNPTVFICGTYLANQSEEYVKDKNDNHYFNGGDWLPKGLHDNKLWGGLDPDEKSGMKFHTYTYRNVVCHIFDNYGDQKSIFDPCPSGWRVPPGDLWLGFTDDGYNPEKYSEINTATQGERDGAGMYMYMTDWQNGLISFFPTQGTRVPDGKILRTGKCGNYHNATTDENDRVNILHIHRSAGLFRVFETTYYMYYVKSTGGPIRCVRDHK